MNQKIVISAGEASGDLHAANLVKELKQINPHVKVKAMGGDKLRAAGAEVVLDCKELAVMGLVEVLLNYRKLKAALTFMQEQVIKEKPDLLILVDYQEFNNKLAQTAKQHGIKVLFYIGPQVWAWRPNRVYKMKERVDMMAVLFPFEVEFYQKANVPVTFVGNPLVDEVKANKDKIDLISGYGLEATKPIVGLLPGSRRSELKRILPIQLEAARKLKNQKPQLQFVLAVASTLELEEVQSFCKNYQDLNIKLIQDLSYNVMSVCDAMIVASGTATLEAGLMGIPSVIVYHMSPISYAILSRLISIEWVGLVNIVAQKLIMKELIQGNAKPQKIADEICELLDNASYRQNMLDELASIKNKLGVGGGSRKVAQLANSML
ncbi:lipid-A-disaccharide synthase [Aliikangiella sp. G2MR2-5]|uniref:lipid-A-disaccharide synthase n=1 Tax=Aliikangiella sp. G2MR2-5 TaxID=2788943 RepID=UPI0018AAC8D9|nr:lipid-A-disaccharide synthase [Aliikangiella sp. G2MR2-5]